MKLINDIGLIGDSINTVPVMIDLAKKYGSLDVQFTENNEWLFDLLPKKYGITKCTDSSTKALYLDINEAFNYACENDIYMSQCYHHQVGLNTPKEPVRPELELPDIDVPIYDYILAPFGRSAPDEQKWSNEKWVDLYFFLLEQGNTICLLGNLTYDDKEYFGYNCPDIALEFNRPLPEVLNILKKARKGVISIVTGISHLCYALDAKNYLLTGQGTTGWGINPDAKCLSGKVCDFTVDQVLEFIQCN